MCVCVYVFAGLLTYRETALLYDESNPSKVAKNRVAGVVAHEQAHMWFGDLVTCEWWSHAWLNEGFARYFQYFITATVNVRQLFRSHWHLLSNPPKILTIFTILIQPHKKSGRIRISIERSICY